MVKGKKIRLTKSVKYHKIIKDICQMEGGGIRVNKAIFVYAYTPIRPVGQDQGSFSVNLYENDMLVYTRYAVDGSVLKEWQFAIQPQVRLAYMATVEHARGWIRGMFPCLRAGQNARYSCRIGIDGFPLFMLEDIEVLMSCPFRSARGHYARMMYNLLEDISTELFSAGFDLRPDSFSWDETRNRAVKITEGRLSRFAIRQNYKQA